MDETELNECKMQLAEQESTKDFETFLLIEYTSVFVAMLKAAGRYDELDDHEQMTHHTENVLKPYFQRIERKLHQGKLQFP